MKRFVQGQSRTQTTLLPECLDDYVAEDNPVRVIDAFVEQLDLGQLGFEGVDPAATGRAITQRRCLRSISTATSIGCNRAVGWSAKPSATSN
jgi:transposase